MQAGVVNVALFLGYGACVLQFCFELVYIAAGLHRVVNVLSVETPLFPRAETGNGSLICELIEGRDNQWSENLR